MPLCPLPKPMFAGGPDGRRRFLVLARTATKAGVYEPGAILTDRDLNLMRGVPPGPHLRELFDEAKPEAVATGAIVSGVLPRPMPATLLTRPAKCLMN